MTDSVRQNGWYSYTLVLADGLAFQMIGSAKAGSWVRKIATIMELDSFKSNRYPRLIVVRGESANVEKMVNQINRAMTSNRPLPAHNWKVQDVERLRFLFHDDVQDIICDIGGKDEKILEIIKMRGFLFPIYERTSNRGGLPLHGALIEMGRKGVVLAAPGGKGKSTCCRRLPPPWHFLCDDETLVLRDHPKQYLAHPFPTWSEYILHQSERTWNVQRYLPLCAVFFLEQSETDEVVPLGQGQAAAFMNGSSMQVYHQRAIFLSREEERALKKRLFDNACELARAIPAYILRASLRGGFWEKMEEVFK